MNNASGWRLWAMRWAFFGAAMVIILFDMLPLQTLPRNWAGPDLVFCFALAWTLRRPECVPTPLLAVVFLLADFLLLRPPGLAAALMLFACNDMRGRSTRLRDAGFAAEWMRAITLIAFVTISYNVVLALLLVPLPQMTLVIFQAIMTAVFYPIVVGVSAQLFGVRWTAPGDLDTMGQRV